VHIYTKLEEFNLSGSIKDRPAKEMLSNAIEASELRQGMTVLAPTSGNVGVSAASQCSVYGYSCSCVIPAVTSTRKRADMARFGTTLIEVPGEMTEPAIEMAYRLKAERPDEYYLLDQYINPANVRAHFSPPDRRSCCNCLKSHTLWQTRAAGERSLALGVVCKRTGQMSSCMRSWRSPGRGCWRG